MASLQTEETSFDVQAGTGPEYDYPTTEKDAAIPVIHDNNPKPEEGFEKVVGEDSKELTDEEIAREEELEEAEAEDDWNEGKAQNTRLPGEAPDLEPDERRLPSDIGG